MSEMVERVCRALQANAAEQKGDPSREGYWHSQARAAIAALREPTGDMIDAGAVSFYRTKGDNFTVTVEEQPSRAWRAMIDKALR